MELGSFAFDRGLTRNRTASLAVLVKLALHKRLPKSGTTAAIRVSDWERNELTAAQIQYGVLDAYAGVAVFRKLSQRPERGAALSRASAIAGLHVDLHTAGRRGGQCAEGIIVEATEEELKRDGAWPRGGVKAAWRAIMLTVVHKNVTIAAMNSRSRAAAHSESPVVSSANAPSLGGRAGLLVVWPVRQLRPSYDNSADESDAKGGDLSMLVSDDEEGGGAIAANADYVAELTGLISMRIAGGVCLSFLFVSDTMSTHMHTRSMFCFTQTQRPHTLALKFCCLHITCTSGDGSCFYRATVAAADAALLGCERAGGRPQNAELRAREEKRMKDERRILADRIESVSICRRL